MRTLIFSDIHGNLPAFEAMLSSAGTVDQYVCLGDVVNYGPWSNECVDLLESLPAIRLIGNHEEDFLKGEYSGQTELGRMFFNFCVESFSRDKQIVQYGTQIRLASFTCVHTIGDAYIYPDSTINVEGNYFIGHSHYQFDRRKNGYHVVNVGSVGQNRREINVIDYCIFEPGSDKIELVGLVYDVGVVTQKMKELKYPKQCLEYYRNKRHRT